MINVLMSVHQLLTLTLTTCQVSAKNIFAFFVMFFNAQLHVVDV